MTSRDWYFKDWQQIDQLDKKGKIRHQYIYKGMYYLLPEPVKKFKAVCLTVMGIYTALFLVLSYFPSSGARSSLAGAAGLMQLIPIMLFLMAFYPLIKSPPKMTFRRYHRIFYRMRIGASVAAGVLGAQIVLEIRYLYLQGINIPDLIYLFILLADFIMMMSFTVFILRLKIFSDDPDPAYPIPPDE